MMDPKGEPSNSTFTENVKRMKICSEENEGDGSSLSKYPYGKGKNMAAQKQGASGSTGHYTNWPILKADSCIEDGTKMRPYVLNDAKDAENRGEALSSSEDGSNKRLEGREESIFVKHIPEEILAKIFCEIPLHTLFQMQIVSTSWQSVFGSAYLHNLWEQSNVQNWLVMELYDQKSGSSKGFAFYDVSKKLRYNKVFNEEWRSGNFQWLLRAGDGGLLVYSCKTNGIFQVVNLLTMQSHYLEDARLTRKSKLSYYVKKYHDDVAVQVNFDPKEKTYQITVIIGNLNLLRSKKFFVLTYKSGEERWEIRDAPFERRLRGYMTISFSPNIFKLNQKIYWFPKDGEYVFVYDLNGDGNIRYQWIPLVRHQPLGIVMYKGSIMMVSKCDPRLPPYKTALIFDEFDELQGNWTCKYEAIVSPAILFEGLICVGGDYIWIIQKHQGCVYYIMSIDLDSGDLKTWPGEVYPSMLNVRKCLSMPLSFSGVP